MAASRLMLGAPKPHQRRPIRIVVFEERLGWEKPCGGGLSHKVLQKYPFLLREAGSANPISKMEIRAPGDESMCLHLRKPVAIWSRRELNHYLLERSREAGAEVVNDRVISANREGGRWRLRGRTGSYEADYLIVAAGARCGLRNQLAGAFKAQDFLLTFGYFVPGRDDTLRVEFFESFEGYAWSFPRSDHLSVGICGKAGQAGMADLKQRLSVFVARYGYSTVSAPVFSHLLPALDAETWTGLKLEGPGWALAGDAAGLTDPITGEGLYFAMRSGELLANALLAQSSYSERVWNEFGKKLKMGAQICPKFYKGKFLGAGVTTRMVQFCNDGNIISNLLQDLVEGNQSYRGLPKRVFRTLPVLLAEMAAHSVGKRIGTRFAQHG